jgi:hypothetical protein
MLSNRLKMIKRRKKKLKMNLINISIKRVKVENILDNIYTHLNRTNLKRVIIKSDKVTNN